MPRGVDRDRVRLVGRPTKRTSSTATSHRARGLRGRAVERLPGDRSTRSVAAARGPRAGCQTSEDAAGHPPAACRPRPVIAIRCPLGVAPVCAAPEDGNRPTSTTIGGRGASRSPFGPGGTGRYRIDRPGPAPSTADRREHDAQEVGHEDARIGAALVRQDRDRDALAGSSAGPPGSRAAGRCARRRGGR